MAITMNLYYTAWQAKEGSYLLLCCKISPKFGQNQQSEKETRFYLDTQQRIWYCNHA